MSEAVAFSLDGREVAAAAGETIWQVAAREGVAIPHLCHSAEPGYRPDGNCRACMVEVEGERVLAASCIRRPAPGMKVRTDTERARHSRRTVFELLLADQPPRASAREHDSRFWSWTERVGLDESRFPGAPFPARPRLLPSRDAGRARRLHPVQPVCAGVPRGPGERRHRHGLPGARVEHRLRLRRSDGREHLRRVRRVRAGVSDGGAHGDVARGRGGGGSASCAPGGGERLPLLRGRVPDHLPRRGRSDRVRQRPQRPVQRAAPVREGPLRIRLRRAPGPADRSARPARRCAEVRGRSRRPREPLEPLPRGELGGGSRARGGRAPAHPGPGRRGRPSPDSAPPRGRTRRRTSSRR